MPRQLHILFNLLALFVITYIVVDTFYRVVEIKLHRAAGETAIVLKDLKTSSEKHIAASDYAIIVRRNIFGATEKVIAPPVEVKIEPLETLEETTLRLSLLGTIAGDSESARAIILDQKQRSQDLYRISDSVQGAEIKQILRGKVILRHGGKDEILTMVEGDQKPGRTAKKDRPSRLSSRAKNAVRSKPQPPGEIARQEEEAMGEMEVETIPIAQDVLQSSMSNLNELMTQVRVRPYFRQGKPEGLIVSQIQADSIFQKLGLMNGDIIASVNGKQMSSPDQAIQLYNSLKSGSQVSIEITRRGQKKLLNYEIQ